jgi:hypothetical protein
LSDSDESVELLRLWDDGEAELVRRLLDSYSIPCRISSQITHSIWPLTVDGLGEIKILVAADQLEDARQILAEHRRQGMEMLPGGKAADEPPDK